MEGCSNLGGFNLCSSSISTLWLSDLHCLSKMDFNCPKLKEISLNFSGQENDSTDLTAMMDGLGRSCPRQQNIHIASVRLSHADVLALTASNLRGLRMLSLVLGSEITDASIVAIASTYSKLEWLDLSGSTISEWHWYDLQCVPGNSIKATPCSMSQHHFKWNQICCSSATAA